MRGEKPTTLPPRIERALRGVFFRLLWVFIAFGLGAVLTWQYRVEIFRYLLAPAGGQLSATGTPIFTGPTEMFNLTVSLAVKGGVLAALPMLAYQVYSLTKRLLSPQHRRTIRLFMGLALCLYLAGTAFAYYVLLPAGLEFLLTFGAGIATPAIRISEYMELATAMLFWLGLVFEIPLVMMLLAKLRLVSHERFKGLRLYVPIAAIIFGALITPTGDVVNNTLVAVPLVALYEVGVALAWIVRPKERAG